MNIKNIESRSATILLKNNVTLHLGITENEEQISVEFFTDEDLEHEITGAGFTFRDESYTEDEYNPWEGTRYLLRAMEVPAGCTRMGIGTFVVEWVKSEFDIEIWARNPFEGKVGDGADLTDSGLEFVYAMQERRLITEWS